MTDHDHDAHFLSGDPNGNRIEVCCVCNMTRTVTVTPTDTPGHGPYIPEAEATKTVTYGEWG